jgi:hypothetical protein
VGAEVSFSPGPSGTDLRHLAGLAQELQYGASKEFSPGLHVGLWAFVKDPTPITQLGAKTGVQGALAFEKTLILRGMLGGGVAGGPEKHGEENRQ